MEFEKALRAVKVIKDQIQYRSHCLVNLSRGYFREVSFFTRRGGAPENWGDQVLCL